VNYRGKWLLGSGAFVCGFWVYSEIAHMESTRNPPWLVGSNPPPGETAWLESEIRKYQQEQQELRDAKQ
jgi:hypothetical protein